MTIALDPDPEALFGTLHDQAPHQHPPQSTRTASSVRSGGKDLLPVFYDVMELSWRSLGTPLVLAQLLRDHHRQTSRTHVRIFVCYRGNEPVAVAFNGYFNGTVEGMWAGGTPRPAACRLTTCCIGR